MKLDPKQIKGGTLTGNMSLTGTLSLPSLLDDTSSLTGLFIASDNSIKKRSLGTMALLSAASFYDKTTADSTFLKLVGGTLTGHLTVYGDCAARGTNGIGSLNPSDINASVFLNFDSNIARIRVGGTGNGAMNGFSIQGPGNSSLLRILANTYVGIGTTNPTAQLHVVGSLVKFQGLGASSGMLSFGGSGSLGSEIVFNTQGATIQNNGGTNELLQYKASASHVFWVNNVEIGRITSTGLGIGTKTPSEKLAVVGNISMLGMFKLNAILGTTGQFIKNTGTLSEWANITTSDITGLYLGTKLLMEDTRTSFGNGIYTYRTYNGQTTNNPTGLFYGQILNWGGGASGGQAQVAVGWTPSDNNYIAFRSLRDSADNWYSWKRIYHEGYKPSVGDINGLASYSGLTNYLRLTGGTLSGTLTLPLLKIEASPSDTVGQGSSVYLNGGTGTSYTYLQQGLGRFIIFGFGGSSWEEKMTIRHSDGFIGIGTPNPIYRLDVNGTARFTGNVNFNTHIILNNDRGIYWKDTSGADRRFLALSTNNSFYIGDIDNAISGGVNNFFANQQHNFFVNNDLKYSLVNGWIYTKGCIQAYGVVNTQVRTDSSDGIAAKMQSVNGNSVYMGSESNHYLNFITNNVIRATIDTAGNFGIGTTPQTKLHVGGGYGQLNGLAIGSLDANEYSTLLFTENYGNGVTHLFSLKHTIGYGDLALAEYGGRVGIGTDRPNVKLDVRGTIRIGNNGFVTGSAGSFMDIWHTNSTGNSQVNLQAWSNGGNTYDSIVLQPLSGEVRIGMPTGSYYKLNVGGTAKIDGFLRLGENLALNCNQFGYWQDSLGTDRRIIGMNAAHSIYLGDIDRTISNSNLILLANSTHWFYVGQANIAVITSSGLDVKGNYYQNGVLKTFFSGNYNDLANRPDLGSYVLTSSIVQDELNVNATNSNAVAAKVLFSMKDTIYANMNAGLNGKANTSHTHDWSSITGKPTFFSGNYNDLSNKPVFFDGNYNNLSNLPNLSSYLTYANVETGAFSNDRWISSNTKITSVQFLKGIIDNLQVQLDSKASSFHTHDWSSITGKPTLFDGNYNNLSNKPTLFDGNYYSLSNRPDLGNYLYGSVNASNRLEIMRTISFTSNIEMAALSTPQLVVTSILNCQGQLTVNADMNVMNPQTLTNSQINKTSIVGVYVDFGNKLTRLTLTQFKNLMATV